MLNCNDYTVGWICATHTENVAAQEFLDEEHEGPESVQQNDNNIYTLGRIGKHNVVIAALPHGQYGLVNAGSVARDMVHSFPNVRIGLLVGVGGGAPSAAHDIRLGDVVVSSSGHSSGGIFQLDFGKKTQGKEFATTGFLNQPPIVLLNAIQTLRAKHERKGHQIQAAIEAVFQNNTRLRAKYRKPDPSSDRLYKSSFIHPVNDNDNCTLVCGDDGVNLISRAERSEDEDNPAVHYGLIASGNQLVRDAELRDKLALERDVLCFEMEAAGLMNHFPCLVIRGISDYSDTHKSKSWQGYASMTAAAYAKELLNIIPPNKIEAEVPRIKSLSKDVSEIKHGMAQVKANQANDIELKVLDWLTDMAYGNEHSDICNRRLPTTSEWFLKTKEFIDWLSSSGRTLFCEGMPGAGKTLIASAIVDKLIMLKKQDGIIYIYCNYKRAETQTIESLLKAMLRQLLETRPPLPEAVKALYEKHSTGYRRPTLEEIRHLLRLAVASYARVFIVIDALDECIGPDDCRSRFLGEIQHLQESYDVNVLATSRHLPEVRNKPPFRDGSFLELHAHDEDIKIYLDDRISRFPSFVRQNFDLQRTIKDKIRGIINGMFLLARLYMDAIQDRLTSNSVKEALSTFGTNSDAYAGAYEAAIGRIESQKSDRLTYAKKLLSWISFAKRELAVFELEHALAVEPGAKGLDIGDIPDLRDVVSFCAGLVSIDQRSRIVKLVHLTAQTFLENNRVHLFPNTEGSIARVCISYQCFDAFASGYCSTDEEYEERIQHYPLFPYAARYWGQHTRVSSEFDYALRLMKLGTHIQGSFQALKKEDRSIEYPAYGKGQIRNITALHLVVSLGLSELVESLVEIEIDAKDSCGQTPLLFAAAKGHQAMVRALLQRGAAINQADEDGRTPLWLAVQGGHEATVRVLVEFGPSIDQPDGDLQTPMLLAADMGYEAIVRLLIEHGAAMNQADNVEWTPLSSAAAQGHEVVVRMLIEHGAAINQVDNKGWTPLSFAAAQGHKAVVRMLIEHGAAINQVDNKGWTPLSFAAAQGHKAVVRMLIEHGAATNQVDSKSYIALLIAAALSK